MDKQEFVKKFLESSEEVRNLIEEWLKEARPHYECPETHLRTDYTIQEPFS